MKTIFIGLGEIGQPLHDLFQKVMPEGTFGFDSGKAVSSYPYLHRDLDRPQTFDVMNVCFPYSDEFDDYVLRYQDIFCPELTIIHSTVPIGTSSKFPDTVHSPVLGRHATMESDLVKYVKWVGGPKAQEAATFLRMANLKVKTVATSEETEALKLTCLAKYGLNIAFAEYQKELCESLGFSYEDVIEWDKNYNEHVLKHLRRPVLYAPNGSIGGHCVVPGTRMLQEQYPHNMLNAVIAVGEKASDTRIWHPANVYPEAKIGKRVQIGAFSEIGPCVIGDNVKIGAMCFIPEGVEIENDAWIGPRVTFTNDMYPPSGRDRWEHTLVRCGARIGAASTVLPGTVIGDNALVGAGSVVTSDVPQEEIWAGNPARKIGNVDRDRSADSDRLRDRTLRDQESCIVP